MNKLLKLATWYNKDNDTRPRPKAKGACLDREPLIEAKEVEKNYIEMRALGVKSTRNGYFNR